MAVEAGLYAVVLLGLVVSNTGIGRDTFDVFAQITRRLRGGLGLATVAANAVFAAITGISVASAAVFSRVAVPEMIRFGYSPRFAVGVVAGTSVLGMLIPPSLLMILYGVIAEESIGKMFLSGVIPGLLLAGAFCLLVIGMAHARPRDVGWPRQQVDEPTISLLALAGKLLPIVGLASLVLGGLYGGIFTPTEAGAAGAFAALLVAVGRRSITLKGFWNIALESGHITVSVLFLILAANLFSRMLAMTGLPVHVAGLMAGSGFGPYGFLAVYLLVILVMGMFLDAASIMLIVLPIALPIARSFGMDLIWFGLLTVFAVEIGLLTPPFGLSVFTVKAALRDHNISVAEIFRGAVPYWIVMLVVLVTLVAFPILSLALL